MLVEASLAHAAALGTESDPKLRRLLEGIEEITVYFPDCCVCITEHVFLADLIEQDLENDLLEVFVVDVLILF